MEKAVGNSRILHVRVDVGFVAADAKGGALGLEIIDLVFWRGGVGFVFQHGRGRKKMVV